MWSDHILWLWHSGLFDYTYCCNTPQVNADQLNFSDARSRDRATLQCRTVDRRHVDHSLMMNVTWQRMDQTAKRLAVGHATIYRLSTVVSATCKYDDPRLKMSHSLPCIICTMMNVTWQRFDQLAKQLIVGHRLTTIQYDTTQCTLAVLTNRMHDTWPGVLLLFNVNQQKQKI